MVSPKRILYMGDARELDFASSLYYPMVDRAYLFDFMHRGQLPALDEYDLLMVGPMEGYGLELARTVHDCPVLIVSNSFVDVQYAREKGVTAVLRQNRREVLQTIDELLSTPFQQ